jgi:hypothetical protein
MTIKATTAPLSSASTGEAVASPEPRQTGTPGTTSTPPPTEQATSFEEDCMASCHIPGPNESFGTGAKPLLASHVGRITCLECHSTAGAPVLPATHLGRLDASCRGCHK